MNEVIVEQAVKIRFTHLLLNPLINCAGVHTCNLQNVAGGRFEGNTPSLRVAGYPAVLGIPPWPQTAHRVNSSAA